MRLRYSVVMGVHRGWSNGMAALSNNVSVAATWRWICACAGMLRHWIVACAGIVRHWIPACAGMTQLFPIARRLRLALLDSCVTFGESDGQTRGSLSVSRAVI